MAQWQSLLSGGRMACQGETGHLVDSLRQTGSGRLVVCREREDGRQGWPA